jgi:hypothetical protein
MVVVKTVEIYIHKSNKVKRYDGARFQAASLISLKMSRKCVFLRILSLPIITIISQNQSVYKQ